MRGTLADLRDSSADSGQVPYMYLSYLWVSVVCNLVERPWATAAREHDELRVELGVSIASAQIEHSVSELSSSIVIVELRFATTASLPGAYIFGVGQFGILLLSHALLRPHSEKVTWGIVTPRLIDGRACLTLHNKVRNMLQMSTIYSEDHEAVKKI